MPDSKSQFDVAVVGGGAAGMLAAISAARTGARVILLEKNPTLGKKLLLTGGGRCNLMQTPMTARLFVEKLGPKAKFLFSALANFGPQQTWDFFENLGVPLKIEADGRVFPQSNSAEKVLAALQQELQKQQVTFLTNASIEDVLLAKQQISGLQLATQTITAKNYILATGGKSFAHTGSNGDGYAWLAKLGHTINRPVPALTPLNLQEAWVKKLAGISLPQVGISLLASQKKISLETGQLVFTHFGLSGPVAINASRKIVPALTQAKTLQISLDLFAQINQETLLAKIDRLFQANPRKNLANNLAKFLPERLVEEILPLLALEKNLLTANLSKSKKIALANLLKNLSLTVATPFGFEQAMVTCGGVALEQIDSKTMRSKIISNLFLAGEILDLDGPTGGYNLQIAWTTGFVAGQAASQP